mgnify:CR=1 FL=1
MASYEVQFRKSVIKDLDPIPKRDVQRVVAAIADLADKFDIVLIDGEAGVEQINRRLAELGAPALSAPKAGAAGHIVVGLFDKLGADLKRIGSPTRPPRQGYVIGFAGDGALPAVVVAGAVGRRGEVNGADGELFDELSEVTEESATQSCADPFEIEVKHSAVQEAEQIMQCLRSIGLQDNAVTTGKSILSGRIQCKGGTISDIWHEYFGH